MMNITFLGTSQAIPTAKRNHTSVLLQYNGENILIDCGEGTQRQFRKAHLNPCKLTRILITHWHGDHVLGLPGLFQTLLLNSFKGQLDIYGPRGITSYLKRMIELFVPYSTLDLRIHEVTEGVFFQTKDFQLEAESMKHSIPCNAYAFTLKSKLRLDKSKIKKLKIPNSPLLGELQRGENITFNKKLIKSSQVTYKTTQKKIAFIFDTVLNNNCYKIAKDSDVLIAEAVYLKAEAELAKLHEHLTAEQVAIIAKKTKVNKLFLAHLSQRYDGSEYLILKEAKKKFKNTIIAEDLMKIEI